MNENVNSPDHYNGISGIECIDVVEHMDFCTGNAVKYLWRAGLKHEQGMTDAQKTIEDLEKAIWYVKRKISGIKKANNIPEESNGISVWVLKSYGIVDGFSYSNETKVFSSESEAMKAYNKSKRIIRRIYPQMNTPQEGSMEGMIEYSWFKKEDCEKDNCHIVLTKFDL